MEKRFKEELQKNLPEYANQFDAMSIRFRGFMREQLENPSPQIQEKVDAPKNGADLKLLK